MLSILSQPLEIEPVYSIDGSNLSCVLDSTESGNYAFRYVQQIGINGITVAQTRVAPNIEAGLGKGVLQPNRIMEDFLSYDRHITQGFQTDENSFIRYDIQFGEESDGTLDGSNGDYIITLGPTITGYVWNGTVQYDDSYTYLDYLMGQTGSAGDFLSNSPGTQDIGLDESSFLYWLNGIGCTGFTGGTAPSFFPLAMQITITGATSTDTYWILPSVNLTDREMTSLAVGPADLNELADLGHVYDDTGAQVASPIITCDTVSYALQITDYEVAS